MYAVEERTASDARKHDAEVCEPQPRPGSRFEGLPRDRDLPPGQRLVRGFPRFGTHLARPAPPVPVDPMLEIVAAGVELLRMPHSRLASLPRCAVLCDFHCVAGWTAVDLRWEGVSFAALYREVIAPALPSGFTVHSVVFAGLDRYRSAMEMQDAMSEDVLIADCLDGRPLDTDHGAPARLVSPQQYGYVSTKHLCRIELHATRPDISNPGLFDRLVTSHPRARVWHEERHGQLPGWLVRPIYRATQAPVFALSARGSAQSSMSSSDRSRRRRRIPTVHHHTHPWRIHALVPDFRVEDVWALPVPGGADDFDRLLEVFFSIDPGTATSLPTRLLWRLRDELGGWLGLGRISATNDAPAIGPRSSLIERLPEDLRNTAGDHTTHLAPFTPLYRTDREFAAELSNRTAHVVLHLGWLERNDGDWCAHMAVYVKPHGALGQAYMTFIKPLRYAVVYPELMRAIERAWWKHPQNGIRPYRHQRRQ